MVALAALHHVGIDLWSYFGAEQLDSDQHQGANLDANSESDVNGEEGVCARDARIRVAVDKHTLAFGSMADPKDQNGSLWPPGRCEIKQFERFSDGIHVSGPSVAASSSSPGPPPGRVKPSPDGEARRAVGSVEVRGWVMWIKHIRGLESLQAQLTQLSEYHDVELNVNGVRGLWRKMKNKGDRPTPGLNPQGLARLHWHDLYAHSQGERFRVPISRVEEDDDE